ncbi:MAG: histidine phosphatase family protein [Chitinophagales bacterium]
MKLLTIIRHAKSSWENPELDDIIRPLNERGKQAIGITGNYLKSKKIKPDLMISSPATRALQTAIGIGAYVNYQTEDLKIEQDIYFGGTASVIRILKNTDNRYADVFLFGHEPMLSSVIFSLSGEALEKFPTCAVYRMQFDITAWNEISQKKGKCEFYVNPKLLSQK